MKRVSVLRRGAPASGSNGESNAPEHAALLAEVRERLISSLARQAECFRSQLIPELDAAGIHLRNWDALTPAQREEASAYFDSEVSPAVTPLVFDPEHPFPFLSNLSTSLAFYLRDPSRGVASYARVKVPGVVRQWVGLEKDVPAQEKLFIPLHEVIRGNIDKLYCGMELTGTTLFRLTRDAEVEIDEAPETSLREVVREQVRQRRYEPVIRMEFAADADASLREMLRERFKLAPTDIYDLAGELDYTTLFQIASLPIPALRDTPWTPLTPPALETNHDIFGVIRGGDLLVHHPYESFEASVECFISAAAGDPATVAVKMTAYRVGDDTPFVKSLVNAAESGKQVACAIEIKARFDEERNLHWAAELERAGAHVTFGVQGLKTHAKVALIVRKEGAGLRSYAHIGTGNYHVRTSHLYADFGLFTCDPRITRDVVNLFHYLTGHSVAPCCSSLLVAPTTMRPRILELIRREIANKQKGLPARIIAKMNQLEDPELIEALCAASSAGVPVDLIVRGLCCPRPGVAARTEKIRVRSIIGRFLEHSRIFHFAAALEDPAQGDFFIGSADWMYRNLSRRVEVVTPIFSGDAKQKLWNVLDVCLRDQRKAWVLGEDARYTQLQPGQATEGPEAHGAQETLMELARRAGN